MPDQETLIRRYRELLDEIRPLQQDWAKLLRAITSGNPADLLVFDEVALARLTEQLESLDQELVEIENELPDDLPDCHEEAIKRGRSA